MNYNIDNFTNYISSKTWKNAKTFENFAPHEYVLSFPCEKTKAEGKCTNNCDICKAERKAFEDAVMLFVKMASVQSFKTEFILCFVLMGFNTGQWETRLKQLGCLIKP